MAKSFKFLVAKTGNKKTAAIAKKRTKEILNDRKYYIVIKCEYGDEPAGYVSKYWFQFLEEWHSSFEKYKWCRGEDNFFDLMTNPRSARVEPFYFDSKKEAIEVIKILKPYGIAEDVALTKDKPTIFKLHDSDDRIKKVTYYVCSTTSDRKEKV